MVHVIPAGMGTGAHETALVCDQKGQATPNICAAICRVSEKYGTV